jgi:hypothetical protein
MKASELKELNKLSSDSIRRSRQLDVETRKGSVSKGGLRASAENMFLMRMVCMPYSKAIQWTRLYAISELAPKL